MNTKQLQEEYPNGCAPPRGYADWFDWAHAQRAHGLKQVQCPECTLWLFPQDKHALSCTVPNAGSAPLDR